MSMTKKKVVFFCESVTLAHVARSRLIADHIDSKKYDVVFYCDDYYDHLFSSPAYEIKPLHSTPPQKFIEWNLKSQPIWGRARINEYLERDAEILDLEKPDVVIGDMRHTLQISAKKRAIPYINIINGYWSSSRDITLPIPDVLVRRLLGTNLAQRVFEMIKPIVMIPHVTPFKKIRERHGLPPLNRYTLPDIFCECDYIAYLDLPEIVDMDANSKDKWAIGPILWSPEIETPTWWENIPTNKPIVYVNLGSSGDSSLLPKLVERLVKHDITLIVGTADKHLTLSEHDNLYQDTFIPGDKACQIADVCISNGGSPTAMQALASAVYSIGICFNIDQLVNMHTLRKSGLGEYFYPTVAELAKIERACIQAIENKKDLSHQAAIINNNLPYDKFNKMLQSVFE